MRIRSVAVIAGVFLSAAGVTALVVRQLSGPGARRDATAAGFAAPTPVVTPALDPPASSADGLIELHAMAGDVPLAGAEVRLYLSLPPGPGALEPSWRRAGAVRTDGAGIARLPARAGTYLAAVRAGGFAAAHVELVRPPDEEVTRAEVALAPAVTLDARVTARPEGRPVAARVVAFPSVGRGVRLGSPSAPVEERTSATADASGAVRLEGLAPGTYAVAAEAPDLHPVLLPRVVVPRAGALSIALEPLARISGVVRTGAGLPAAGAIVHGASRDHDASATADAGGRFTLAVPGGSYRLAAASGAGAGGAGPVTVQAGATTDGVELVLGPPAAVEGVVVEQRSGRPVFGAEVALFPHDGGALVARALAGEDGRYHLAALAPGQYDLRAVAPGMSPLLQSGVTLGPGATFPLRVALAGTGAIEGVVEDARGRALAGVRVRVEARGEGLPGALALEARSDFEGRYRIEGVEIGRAELVARQDGVQLGVSRAVLVAPHATSRADFAVPDAGFLVGRISQDGRAAPVGTAVVAVPMKAGPGAPQIARAVADAGGSYSLALPAGEYRVHAAPGDAERTDLRVAPAFARVAAGKTSRLDVAAVAASAEEGLEVLVLEPGGAPSPGAVVTLARAGDDRIALATSAGEDGRVVLAKEMGLAGAPVTMRARSGGRSGVFTGALPASGVIAVRLERGGAIEGVVRASGAAPRSLVVEVASQPAASGWSTTDVHRFAGARFALVDLPTGPVRLTVRADDGRRGAAELSLAPGETRALEIALQPAAGR
ncbi:MAG TPA: carboxypeptidase-like regulatory domain-containing protein [Anaeromyxobacter sp.]|nr:carboxypeptidase-like regulatory domain-containing protein [Anaeromyxobacter sp.]